MPRDWPQCNAGTAVRQEDEAGDPESIKFLVAKVEFMDSFRGAHRSIALKVSIFGM